MIYNNIEIIFWKMTENKFSSILVDNIQLKVKSLEILLCEIKQCNHNYEFDLSICDDIYAYIRNILTDCHRVVNNNKYNLFSTEDFKIQNNQSMVH